jgi:hypothetical protein
MAVTWRGHKVWYDGERRSWHAHCSCGWVSTTRATEDNATAAALNHLWRVTVAPEYPVKGRMVKRHGETMSKREFMDALRASA